MAGESLILALVSSRRNGRTMLIEPRECWCGDSLSSTGVEASAETQCSMKCLGNSSELCGGMNRLTLVILAFDLPAVNTC